jgi:hypothetical protein
MMSLIPGPVPANQRYSRELSRVERYPCVGGRGTTLYAICQTGIAIFSSTRRRPNSIGLPRNYFLTSSHRVTTPPTNQMSNVIEPADRADGTTSHVSRGVARLKCQRAGRDQTGDCALLCSDEMFHVRRRLTGSKIGIGHRRHSGLEPAPNCLASGCVTLDTSGSLGRQSTFESELARRLRVKLRKNRPFSL